MIVGRTEAVSNKPVYTDPGNSGPVALWDDYQVSLHYCVWGMQVCYQESTLDLEESALSSLSNLDNGLRMSGVIICVSRKWCHVV